LKWLLKHIKPLLGFGGDFYVLKRVEKCKKNLKFKKLNQG
jgi:hypothetical protein